MDLYDHVQEDDLKQAANHAAMRDEKLPRKRLPGN